jgi:hypothetical protein
VEEVGKEGSAGRRDSCFASKWVVGTGEIEREDSEHCVGCIKGHWIGGIWMVIISLGGSPIHDRVDSKRISITCIVNPYQRYEASIGLKPLL